MLRLFRVPPERRPTKYRKLWHVSLFIRYLVIIVCLILLPLDEYFYDVVDDFTPAYPRNTSDPAVNLELPPPEDNTNAPDQSPTGEPSSDGTTTISPKRNVRNVSESCAEKPEGDQATAKSQERGTSPPGFQPLEADKENRSKTRLSHLLIMYPCCTTILIILGMEMCGQMLLDPMTKCTNLFLIILCIGLSIVVFVVSLIAALRTLQPIMIVIAALSAVFILLEIIDSVVVCSS